MSVHYDKGLLLYQQRRFDLAEGEFRKALSEEPENPYGHAMLAAAHSAQGQSEKGIKEAQIAIKLNPTIAYPHYILSLSQLAAGRPGDAEKSIKEALRIEPTSATYLNHAGEIALVKCNWKVALKYAEEAMQEDPEDVEAINTRAQALVKLGRYAEAEESLATALRLQPDDAMTHSNTGWTLVRRGRIEEAIEHFKEALRLNPNSEWAYEGVVEALKARNPLYHMILMNSLSLSEMSTHLRTTLWWICWIVPPLRALMLFVFFATFCTKTAFTVLLRLDPLGRRVLTDKAKRDNNKAVAVVVVIIGGIMFLCMNPQIFEPKTHKTAVAAQKLFKEGKKAEAMQLWQSIADNAKAADTSKATAAADLELKDLIDVMRSTDGVDKRFQFNTRMQLGNYYMHLERYNAAEDVFAEAAIVASEFPSRVYHAMARFNLALARARQYTPDSRLNEIADLRAALAEFEKDGEPNDPRFRAMLHTFAETLRESGNAKEADIVEQRAKNLDAKDPGTQDPGSKK